MGTLRFFEEVVSFKIRRTFGFADYKIPSERANLIFFQHKLTSETPSYLHYDKTIPTKTTLFFGNPYATNLF